MAVVDRGSNLVEGVVFRCYTSMRVQIYGKRLYKIVQKNKVERKEKYPPRWLYLEWIDPFTFKGQARHITYNDGKRGGKSINRYPDHTDHDQ